jgi:cobyric acid synthase
MRVLGFKQTGIRFAKEQHYSVMSESALGRKMETQVWVGKISIKFFENGVIIKPHSQAKVVISNELAERLSEALKYNAEKKKMLDNL